MVFPDLNNNSKTEDGRRLIVEAIAQQTLPVSLTSKEIYCWKMFHDIFDTDQFLYLRKIGEYELPAQMRHFPRQRPMLNNLISRQNLRKFPFSLRAVDKASLKKKNENKFKAILDLLYNQMDVYLYNFNQQIQQIEIQKQQVLEALSQIDQQNIPNKIQAKSQLTAVLGELQHVIDLLGKKEIISKEQLADMDKYHTYTHRDFVEEIGQKGLLNLRTCYHVKQRSVEAFTERCVTGREYFYVDYIPENNKLHYEVVNGLKVTYSTEGSQQWTNDSDWVALTDFWSYNNILSYFDKWPLSTDHKKLLEKKYASSLISQGGNSRGNFVSIPGAGAGLTDST